MSEVKITIKTASGVILNSMEELDEYVKDIELPEFIQKQVDKMCTKGGAGCT